MKERGSCGAGRGWGEGRPRGQTELDVLLHGRVKGGSRSGVWERERLRRLCVGRSLRKTHMIVSRCHFTSLMSLETGHPRFFSTLHASLCSANICSLLTLPQSGTFFLMQQQKLLMQRNPMENYVFNHIWTSFFCNSSDKLRVFSLLIPTTTTTTQEWIAYPLALPSPPHRSPSTMSQPLTFENGQRWDTAHCALAPARDTQRDSEGSPKPATMQIVIFMFDL